MYASLIKKYTCKQADICINLALDLWVFFDRLLFQTWLVGGGLLQLHIFTLFFFSAPWIWQDFVLKWGEISSGNAQCNRKRVSFEVVGKVSIIQWYDNNVIVVWK